MKGRDSSAVPIQSWLAREEGCFTSTLSRCCRRMRPDEVKGLVTNGAKRTVRSKAGTLGLTRKVTAGSARGRRPNEPLHVTAARWRFLLNLNGHGGAAACERGR